MPYLKRTIVNTCIKQRSTEITRTDFMSIASYIYFLKENKYMKKLA